MSRADADSLERALDQLMREATAWTNRAAGPGRLDDDPRPHPQPREAPR